MQLLAKVLNQDRLKYACVKSENSVSGQLYLPQCQTALTPPVLHIHPLVPQERSVLSAQAGF